MAEISTETFESRVDEHLDLALNAASDGWITWAEWGELYQGMIVLAVATASELAASGKEKKANVLKAVSAFLEVVPLPLPWWLTPFKSLIKSWLLGLADGAIEAVYELLKKTPSDPKPAA